MKNCSKLILIILTTLIIMIVNGCGLGNHYKDSIYNDKNKIIKVADSYTYFDYVGKKGKTIGDKTDIKFTSFTGMETIYKIKADEGSNIVFNFESVIDKGDFKVVLITPDNEIINIVEGTKKGSETILLKKGISRMKFVGKKTNGQIKINIDGEKNIKIQED